ncbi:protein of unknown function [Candidatus Nitrospira inopinata]|uniref:Uncharacterized protein n=1 Tax=Candidatus Nitrospira inopinata TaxID=1715989 RepID=A0A0S4KUH4_9BACT|nr:protein of unknown function [Candidatus Nitrospira inopinata]
MKEDYWGPLDAQKAGRKAEADKVWSVSASKIQPVVSEGRSAQKSRFVSCRLTWAARLPG